MYRMYKGKLIDKAITADFSNMRKFGFDHYPVFFLHSRAGKDGQGEFYIKPNDMLMVRKAIELGFKGRIILVEGTSYFIKRYCPNGINDENEKVYSRAITEATRKFMAKCKSEGLPEQIYFPFDEPRTKRAKISAITNAAMKKAGAITLVTDRPTAGYNACYYKLDAIDIWCSQPFAVPYEKVVTDKHHRYWAYPNHIAGEIKDRVVMQKGGRMTYGYGLWRSGYETLMPWAWRWFPGPGHLDQFNYFNANRSGTGNRIDEQANFIPAIYWECFREGYDDGRYLYTLEQVMLERKDNKDPKCQTLIRETRKLLNEIWAKIVPEKRYLKCKFFDDNEFVNLCWRIANLTLRLLKYKGKKGVTAPSVLANTSLKCSVPNAKDVAKRAIKAKTVSYLDLAEDNFAGWQPSGDKELKFFVEKGKMVLDLHVDYEHDGLHKDNKYPIGWPMVVYGLTNKVSNNKDYDFLVCKIKFVSDQKNIGNITTKIAFVFRKTSGKEEYHVTYDLGNDGNTWKTVYYIPLDNALDDVNIRSNVKDIVLLPYEALYPDGSHITFTIAKIGLLKIRQPLIKRIDSVDTVLSGVKNLKVGISGFAFDVGQKQGYKCVVKLENSRGKIVAEKSQPLTNNLAVMLPVNNLSVGDYKLIVDIYDNSGRLISSDNKKVTVIENYL